METIDNETLRLVLTLIGPAGIGLIGLSGVLFLIIRELWKELKASREKHIESIDLNTKAMNDLAEMIKRGIR